MNKTQKTKWFAVISDVHIDTRNPEPSVEKFKIALSQLKTRAGGTLDAVLVAGDLGDHKDPQDIRIFKDAYESVFSPEDVPLVHCYGDDHDFVWADPEAPARIAEYNGIFGKRYFARDVDPDAIPLGNRHAVIGGYHILALEPCGRRPILYSEQTKCWLDQTLRALTEAEPDRYVLILTHPMLSDTVYGSELRGGAWATEDLTEILSRYPQALVFAGHLHFPLIDPRSIMQTRFTSVGTGAVRYLGIETDGFTKIPAPTWVPDSLALSQGLLIELPPDRTVRIHRLNFAKNAEIGTPWVLDAPQADGSHLSRYSRARGDRAHNQPPVLSDFTLTSENNKLILRFPLAKDDEFTHHFVVSFGEPDGVCRRRRVVTDFYSVCQTSEMKPDYETVIENFEYGKTYFVSLTAFDSWDAQSQTVTKQITLEKESS